MSEPNTRSALADADPGFVRDTRAAYDAIAEEYAREFPDGLGERVLDRALLSGFAELVRARGEEPVADVGSGPGNVTALLHRLGVPVFGVDVSPRMVALARRAHPELRFHIGSMDALDLPDRTLGGLLALFSVIHVPDTHLSAVLAEFRRVLVPGGYLLLCFQTGNGERQRLTERFGRRIVLDYYWRTPESVAARLTEAGLDVQARVALEPEGGATRPRAFLLARRPG
ncbi:class I SAM-dependent DNA methyltransferase [Streptomyces phaeoluteigriseus]|uniref:class I SAM-dependent DNA methyltransferase n=1 Tax=Streptomyces phaeoluteigriseus TaxID=114686 RepID=UPI001FE56EC5|nr:class I SAM-dependent methyltransferase [Streptomyces phaeoluteigriseus]